MKYEIDIDGKIPDEWEVDRIGQGRTGDSYLGPILLDGFFQINQVDRHSGSGTRVIVRRKVRKYDWTQTMPSVLVTVGGKALYRHVDIDTPYPEDMKLSTEWQPNIFGRCPVDPESSIVRIRTPANMEIDLLAKRVNWEFKDRWEGLVVSWKFIGLVDGVEW